MKKILLIIFFGLLLGGCSSKIQQNIIEKTGEIKTKIGNEYLLDTKEGLINITSNKTNLENYLKTKIKVSGMYSGSTLYVDNVEIIKN